MERFWAKVSKTDTCWLWTGSRRPKGYGMFRLDGKTCAVHRLSYEWSNGPIPDGLVIDHLCRTPACVRPDHMEVVTAAENTRRGRSGEFQRTKTHCPQGHLYDEANTYYHPRGQRVCRACGREYMANRKANAQ